MAHTRRKCLNVPYDSREEKWFL